MKSVPAGGTSNRLLFLVAVAALAVSLAFFAARRPIDFRVYYATARAWITGSAPIYGPTSGIGYPQIYRYPPLFLLLFLPFALLPYNLAAAAWAALKFVPLYFLSRTLFVRLGVHGAIARSLAVLPALPYLAVEFHYGNVQFFIFALVAASLLWLDTGVPSVRRFRVRSGAVDQPLWAALALALGISVKVWPLFFLPYLVAAGYRRIVAWTLVVTLGLTLLPAAFLGPRTYARLFGQWASQEFGVASAAGEPGIIGFPSQSLHSVLMRYFVSLDYSTLSDRRYPKFNLLDANPRVVELSWILIAAAGYFALLLLARRRARLSEPSEDVSFRRGAARFSRLGALIARKSGVLGEGRGPQRAPLLRVLGWGDEESRRRNGGNLGPALKGTPTAPSDGILTVHAIAFCALAALEPFTQNGDLVVLLWPIIVAAALLQKDRAMPHWARAALYAALSLMILKPLVPSTAALRALQVVGMDFWLTCLLVAGLLGSLLPRVRALPGARDRKVAVSDERNAAIRGERLDFRRS